jgi:hypothetical protein
MLPPSALTVDTAAAAEQQQQQQQHAAGRPPPPQEHPQPPRPPPSARSLLGQASGTLTAASPSASTASLLQALHSARHSHAAEAAQPGLVVFSGGTAFNGAASALRQLTTRVTHVLPVSDDGGSTAEIVRVVGGPAVGDIRSRCLRLADDRDEEARAVKRLLAHRLSGESSSAAKLEWYSIVEGGGRGESLPLLLPVICLLLPPLAACCLLSACCLLPAAAAAAAAAALAWVRSLCLAAGARGPEAAGAAAPQASTSCGPGSRSPTSTPSAPSCCTSTPRSWATPPSCLTSRTAASATSSSLVGSGEALL